MASKKKAAPAKKKSSPIIPSSPMTKEKQKRIDEFKEYASETTDHDVQLMWEVAVHQKKHPDHMNRGWSGSLHSVPFLHAYAIVEAEFKKRGLTLDNPITDLWRLS